MLLHILHETAYDYVPPVRTAQHMAHLKPSGAPARWGPAKAPLIWPVPPARARRPLGGCQGR